jgi:hypothetical protein
MRFSLLVMLACSVNAVAAETPTAEEKAAMDYVAKAGGSATLDPKLAANARVSAKFETLSDAILAGLKKYPHIGGVEAFDASPCTFKGFAALKELPSLQKLVIGKGALTAAAAAAIGQCKELRHLGLQSCNLTDAQLEQLKPLKLLVHLTLSDNPKVTDKGMQTVKEFDRLQVLYLSKTGLTDRGLMELKGLDGLRTFGVTGTAVTQEAAEKFADDMPNLRAVRR